MCEYSKRLIAWMDGELAANEAAEVEQHVRACAACRECYSAYEAASRDFAGYYAASTEPAVTPVPKRRVPLWVPVAAAVAAVAAIVAIAFVPRAAKQVPVTPQVASASAVSIPGSDVVAQANVAKSEVPQGLKPEGTLARVGTAGSRALTQGPVARNGALRPGKRDHGESRALVRGVSGTGSRSASTDWAMSEPAIQIAIPADAMFPPGAVPEGVTYIANVSLGPNGTVQGITLRP